MYWHINITSGPFYKHILSIHTYIYIHIHTILSKSKRHYGTDNVVCECTCVHTCIHTYVCMCECMYMCMCIGTIKLQFSFSSIFNAFCTRQVLFVVLTWHVHIISYVFHYFVLIFLFCFSFKFFLFFVFFQNNYVSLTGSLFLFYIPLLFTLLFVLFVPFSRSPSL